MSKRRKKRNSQSGHGSLFDLGDIIELLFDGIGFVFGLFFDKD